MRLPPIAIVLLTAAPVPAVAAPQALTIELSNFKFTPSEVPLRHGESYILHLTNTSGGGHDLVAKRFFDAAQVAPVDRGKIHNGEVELGGHQSIDIHLTAPAAGTYEMHCSHFMHETFGMKGAFVVS